MNHGPDDKGPEKPGPGSDGFGGLDDLDGLGSDESALRSLLHAAVDDLEPRSGTLEHLRRAVPTRRARKRQAVVGVAAAALFIGTAIPALVHVSRAGGSDPNTAMAGQSSQAQGGTGQGENKGPGKSSPKDPGSPTSKPGKEPGKPDEKHDKGGHTGTAPGSIDPSATLSADVPLCTAIQLGSATGTVNAPDSAGAVYGSFRVTNVSEAACTVAGPGTVTPTAQGAADQSKISVVRHVAGDAATTLPDPSLEVTSLVLQPGAVYEEQFAFVPSETCPTTGGSTDGPDTGQPSPDPTQTQETGASGGTSDTTGADGTTTQLATEDGTADGSVAVSHTAQGGAPTATAVVPGACAGTVYYTGVLATG
ncbi:hypothetical protein [Streptomyces echinatus]|uniref:hypothetical protein n=1 Tax=Streptomyces echinatus TaxID=67293 RepID=UPI0037B06E04